MANGGRNVTIVSGIYTLFQGLVWSLAATYCISIYDCLTSYPFFQYTDGKLNINRYALLYASYFNGTGCNDGPQFNGLTGVPPSSVRVYYLMFGYAIISAVWIPVSVLLIVAGACKVKGRCGSCFYTPWIIISSAISIADFVAVIFFCVDISRTLNPDDYIKFLGARGTWEDVTGSDRTKKDTAAPAVIMTLVFGRFFIFWLLNISLIYHSIEESNKIRKYNLQGSSSTDGILEDERFRIWRRPNLNRQFHFGDETNTKQQLSHDKEEIDTSKITRRRKPDMNTTYTKENTTNKENITTENKNDNLVECKGNPKTMYKVDEFGIPVEEIKIPRLSNSYTSSVGSETPINSPVFDYLGRPLVQPHHSRTRTEVKTSSEHERRPNLPPPELRGQKPWSYLYSSQSPPIPSDKPQIPTPDYMESSQESQQQFSYTNPNPPIVKKH